MPHPQGSASNNNKWVYPPVYTLQAITAHAHCWPLTSQTFLHVNCGLTPNHHFLPAPTPSNFVCTLLQLFHLRIVMIMVKFKPLSLHPVTVITYMYKTLELSSLPDGGLIYYGPPSCKVHFEANCNFPTSHSDYLTSTVI